MKKLFMMLALAVTLAGCSNNDVSKTEVNIKHSRLESNRELKDIRYENQLHNDHRDYETKEHKELKNTKESDVSIVHFIGKTTSGLHYEVIMDKTGHFVAFSYKNDGETIVYYARYESAVSEECYAELCKYQNEDVYSVFELDEKSMDALMSGAKLLTDVYPVSIYKGINNSDCIKLKDIPDEISYYLGNPDELIKANISL